MKIKNLTMLVLTAFIWGTAFVAQRVGMDDLGPFSFNCIRNFIGAAALLPVIWFFDRKKREDSLRKNGAGDKKMLLLAGGSCGLLLFAASSLQQVGMQYTTAGKSGFITAFYIVFVPVLGLFLHKKVGVKVWIAVVLAFTGLYFLCMTDGFSIGQGDLYVFACALVFSVHIMVVDYFSPKVDCIKMACIQFLCVALFSIPPTMALETFTMADVQGALPSLLYAGVLSSGVAYTLQIVGQKNMNPTVAALIFSLESCFSVLAGWVILGERLTQREMLGCILMFSAIILTQLPEKWHNKIQTVKDIEGGTI